MIYSRTRYYVCCDKCGKTIETNAANEQIADETAVRLGWTGYSLSQYTKYLHLCPKCKEETK